MLATIPGKKTGAAATVPTKTNALGHAGWKTINFGPVTCYIKDVWKL